MQKRKYITCSSKEVFDEFFQRWGKKHIPLNSIFKWYCSEFSMYPLTQSKFQNRLKIVQQIFNTNLPADEKEFKEILNLFHANNNDRAKQLDIRYGPGSGQKFKNLLSEKTKNKIHIGNIQYWINKGLSYTEAIEAKRVYYLNLNKKGTQASLDKLNSNLALKIEKYKKTSITKKQRKEIDYWLQQGFSQKEAEDRIKKYIPPKRDIDTYIKKYGAEEGIKKHKESYQRQKRTTISRYGTFPLSGYVSKSSIKYFKKLYKQLRKSGISKDDVVWGISGRREFTTYDSATDKNYAFDFVIKSKKIIVEYNDPFWHARNAEEWINPMVNYEQSQQRDSNKNRVAKKLGFEIYYIWSDSLPEPSDLKDKILSK